VFLRIDFREFEHTVEFIRQNKKKTKNKKSSATGGGGGETKSVKLELINVTIISKCLKFCHSFDF
jgi:hypothetical protein